MVATSVAGRSHKELEGLFGLFINTLVLRGDLSGNPSFRELLGRVRRVALDAFSHQLAPFERILEAVRPDRDLARNPLFQVMFLFHNLPPVPEVSSGGISFRPEEPESRASMFDLTLALTERAGTVSGFLQYSTDLFDRPTVQRTAARYAALLEEAAAAPDRPLWELPLLLPAERQQTLCEWNDTQTVYPTGVCLHELVAAQAERTPDAVAAVDEKEALTYHELLLRARNLAAHLSTLGVEADGRVGVLLERSVEMIAGLLGILEAGAAYVPLDPSLPAERLAVLIESAGIRVVLAQERHAHLLPGRGEQIVVLDGPECHPEARNELKDLGGRTVPPPRSFRLVPRPQDDVPSRVTSPNLAYVLYTSGSTGTPKGVMIPHRGIVNRLLWMQEAYGLTPDDRVLQKTPFSFDVSLWEFFWPLLVGARLVFARPDGHKDPLYLAERIERERITTLHFVPSMLQAFLDELPAAAHLSSLRKVMASGEALPPELVRRFFARLPHAELHNLYGPTEASVDVSFWPCVPEPPRSIVPIGRPIANHRLHVVDRSFGAQPVGVPGELLLGGPGLARGYLGRPDLTAAAFVPDPFGDLAGEPGGRLYRTGDLVRTLVDGQIQYLGRIDHQVKIRGFRIELGEIESVLGRHPSVRECVVLAREDTPGARYLAAYVTGDVDVPALRAFLAERLPEYMVPAAFVVLPALPLTPNGKVDRKALPAPDRPRAEAAAFVAPSDPVEELLAGLWREVLGIEQIGVRDSFFELGGHSLLATQVRSRVRDLLGVDLPLRKLFEAPTISRLARAVREAREAGAAALPPIAPLPAAARQGDLPLSFAQQRLWLIDQLDPGSAAYNLPTAVRLTGAVSPDLLARVFAALVRRHETLRTTFPAREGRPVQAVAPLDPDWRPELPVVDLSHLPEGEREARARALALDEARKPFDLQRGPLLRLTLLRLGAQDHLLLMTLHHIVSDGWSWGVLLRDVGAMVRGGEALPELPVQYADFAVWQRGWLQGEVLERQIAHWREALAGAPAVLELPTDRPRPALPTHRGGARPVRLSAERMASVHALCRQRGATPFMAWAAAWALLLGRHAGQDQVLVGTPVAGRNRREVEDLIGFFVNTLVLRCDLRGAPPFGELLRRVRETAIDAFTHQDLPFERLVDEIAPDRDLRRPPVFQAMFILQNAPLGALELPGLTLRQVPVDAGAAKFDLTLNLVEIEGGLSFLEYDADLFDEATADRFIARYETLLAGIVAAPDRPLAELPLLPAAERQQLLVDWNDTAEPFPRDRCVHELIAEQAARTPEAVAVSCGGERLSYGELDARAGRLARRLMRLGVGPEVLVGLCAERSPALLVGLLGVLKAGGAYVPLDPTHPRERLGHILADAGAPVLVTEKPLLEALPPHGARIVLLEEDGDDGPEIPLPASDPESLAYVIYTSGSTGRPKGVEVRHRGVVNYLVTMAARPGLGSRDVMVAVTTLSFDIAVTELLLPLAVGARVELVRRETAGDADRLAAVLEESGATCMQATPATWTLLVEGGWKGRPHLKALCGGEAFPRALADKLLPRVGELWNVYGPTETTVWSARHPVGPGSRAVPLGLPLGNTTIHLAGQSGELVPVGAAGELLIGGEGLARGYHGRPDLTAERFVPDPFGGVGGKSGARLYRTGDLARRLPDGTLEYLGRLDHQVKVRGFRIELGEIETVLAGHPAVRECVVVAREDGPGSKMLVAYLVPAGSPDPAELRAFLGAKLPPYMLPAAFVTLEALPLSPNGKVDRKALPAPARQGSERSASDPGGPPRTPTEQLLARVWEEVLKVEGVGAGDNFFTLGGDSILSIQAVFRAREAGLTLEPRDLFTYQTLRELAAVLPPVAPPAGEVPPPSPPSPADRDGGFTPEDFPEARVSQKDLDKLMARIGGRPGSRASTGRTNLR
jgi:amino acid adenylation domain-containing protein